MRFEFSSVPFCEWKIGLAQEGSPYPHTDRLGSPFRALTHCVHPSTTPLTAPMQFCAFITKSTTFETFLGLEIGLNVTETVRTECAKIKQLSGLSDFLYPSTFCRFNAFLRSTGGAIHQHKDRLQICLRVGAKLRARRGVLILGCPLRFADPGCAMWEISSPDAILFACFLPLTITQ